jgi:hypothetical protein
MCSLTNNACPYAKDERPDKRVKERAVLVLAYGYSSDG